MEWVFDEEMDWVFDCGRRTGCLVGVGMVGVSFKGPGDFRMTHGERNDTSESLMGQYIWTSTAGGSITVQDDIEMVAS